MPARGTRLLQRYGVLLPQPTAYGMIYGMHRTTIYLPDNLKTELARAAREEGRTEADLIREGVERLLSSREPEPRLPLFASGQPDLAARHEELLAGFGER
jgi:CopG-like RHH_1 or ribbon-helix-helix domain, RHH_5